MKPNDVIKMSMDTADMITKSFLEDLTDEEMMHRPTEKCNHIKWQLGHLIASEWSMVNGCCDGSMPPLPEGFVERYTKDTATLDDMTAFDSKADLLKLYREQRATTLDVLSKQSSDDLDQPAPEEMQAYAPTVAAVFSMLGIHSTMHTGQWAVIRRQLGRPPLF